MRILIVEDEPLIRRDVATALTASGYIAEEAANGEEAWYKGDVETYDAVVLDLGLPDLDGLAILKRWRASGRTMPVIIVSARGTWRERVDGIDAGADDYLPKPFEMEELLARLHAVLRRASGQSGATVDIGPVVIDTRRSRMTIQGVPVALSPLEFRLVSYLALRRGRPVSQIELTEHLYAQDFERDSNAIEVLIGRLRRKLTVDLIKTKRGFGYMLNEDLATDATQERAP